MAQPVNYDALAPTYNARYQADEPSAVAGWLHRLAEAAAARRILEVGCGTGRWLAELQPAAGQVYGLDRSRGMLGQAQQRGLGLPLAQGQAGELPFPPASLDLVYCLNALHHFPDPRRFIAEALRLLRPGGALAVIGMDPRLPGTRWYIFDYFPGTLATDLQRFPSAGTLVDWMAAAGFERAGWEVVDFIHAAPVGRAVLDDPFLQKHGTSQLVLLSDEAYAAGMGRLNQDLAEAEAHGETLRFVTEIGMGAVVGWKPR